MSIKAIVGIIAVFAVVIVIPILTTVRSMSKDEQREKPAQRRERLQQSEQYKNIEKSELVHNIVQLVQAVPDTVTTELLHDSFTVIRRIDKIGEVVPLKSKKELHFASLDDETLELVGIAAENALGENYICSPRIIGTKKDKKQDGYYIFLDPKQTDKIITERTDEAVYNGERTKDF